MRHNTFPSHLHHFAKMAAFYRNFCLPYEHGDRSIAAREHFVVNPAAKATWQADAYLKEFERQFARTETELVSAIPSAANVATPGDP